MRIVCKCVCVLINTDLKLYTTWFGFGLRDEASCILQIIPEFKTEHFYSEPLPHSLLSDPWVSLIYAQLIWLCSLSSVALFPVSSLCVGARLERGILSPRASQQAQLRPWQCPQGHMAKCGILLITIPWWRLARVAVLLIFICPAVYSKCIIYMLTFKKKNCWSPLNLPDPITYYSLRRDH